MKVSPLVLSAVVSLAAAQFGCNHANSNQSNQSNQAAAASPTPDAPPPSEAATVQEQQDAAGLLAQGIELYRRNRDREAVETFRKAAELDPEYAEAYHRLGMAHVALGERKEAQEAFERAIKFYEKRLKREPKDVDALYRVADSYGRTGDYQKASESYRRAEKLRDPDASTYYDMGLVYNKLAKYEDAAKAFGKAVELDPNDYRAQEAWDRAKENASKQKARIEHEKKLLERKGGAGGNKNANRNNSNQNNSNQNNSNQTAPSADRQTGPLS